MGVSMDQRAMEISVNEGFDRLQRILTTMDVGDDITPVAAAEQTGLSEDVCRAMLAGLERAGLMTQGPAERFTRCTLDLLKT
jgi:hypothetical protein